MDLTNIDILSKKIEDIVQKYAALKNDKERIEGQMLKKDREGQAVKKRLEKALKERDVIKQKLNGILQKIDSLE